VRVSKSQKTDWATKLAQTAEVTDPLLIAPELEDFQKDGLVASREQLHSVSADPGIRSKLNSKDLQQIIAAVDTAAYREAALAQALQNPSFAQFCESVLDVVSPGT
jgi:hypothetical protein